MNKEGEPKTFTPDDIKGLTGHWDAADKELFVKNPDGTVTWKSKVGDAVLTIEYDGPAAEYLLN